MLIYKSDLERKRGGEGYGGGVTREAITEGEPNRKLVPA